MLITNANTRKIYRSIHHSRSKKEKLKIWAHPHHRLIQNKNVMATSALHSHIPIFSVMIYDAIRFIPPHSSLSHSTTIISHSTPFISISFLSFISVSFVLIPLHLIPSRPSPLIPHHCPSHPTFPISSHLPHLILPPLLLCPLPVPVSFVKG